ncbi:hypothetical protein LC049_02025 [Nitratireductor aquimarinus]|uniref:hypothetical protein n=1 Tax=Alphaproteobacteria TaxID=28211 RepID=UPI001CD6649F|nr:MULTISPECIES: hypothetical protein [Alphaproteobacteria]MCA1260929.1 hypothetical protein [Nitratireductor aquimarinus]MCA1301256.1 hypothetical protein [Nitratireductor aquimarinus]MDJ1462411.1 hypothetical protein [Nitratireductor sp. GZWM139]MDV2968297.1 hypothetical protein [Nitratireductor aquimarinus]
MQKTFGINTAANPIGCKQTSATGHNQKNGAKEQKLHQNRSQTGPFITQETT